MFERLLKSKFHTKCKSSIMFIKRRFEMIKRKRNAMQKYLKNDIADLLKNGLDYNAYGRAEGYLVELNLSTCYDFVEQSCGCILNHLSIMSEQRECPEECRDAVSSLMFAAARFADLPELRELRSIFTDRYGNSIESFVNKEFSGMLKASPPTKDMKFQLMQNIAQEIGIEWNSKALEQQLYTPPVPQKDWSKDTNNDRNNQTNMMDTERRSEQVKFDGHQMHKIEKSPSNDFQIKNIDNNNLQTSSNSVTSSSSEEKAGDDRRRLSYRSIPPPYTRPEVADCAGPRKFNDYLDEKAKAKGKPRSVRTSGHLKSPPGNANFGSTESDERRKKDSDGNKQEDMKRDGHYQSDDEEERVIDKLLIHYSKKMSHSEPEKAGHKREGEEDATFFQPDISKSCPVHPKLLDYDDFVTRLAALTERENHD